MRLLCGADSGVSGDDTGSSLERMTFQVTAMSSLVSFSRKKTKFVFDETIYMKDGWRQRNVVSQDPLSPA